MGKNMLYQNVTKTESIENVINNKFLFCKEMGVGMVKKDLSSLNLLDFSFENVVNKIKSTDISVLEQNGLDAVLFENGFIVESNKLLKQVQSHVFENELYGSLFEEFKESRRLNRRYFKDINIEEFVPTGELLVKKLILDDEIDFSYLGVSSIRDIHFGKNGKKFYVLCSYNGSADTVVEVDLTTAYDVTTGTVANSFDIDDYTSITGYSIRLSEDGTKLYANGNSEFFEQFNLTTPWSLGSFTYERQPEKCLRTDGNDVTAIYAFDISEDGSSVYVSDSTSNSIYQYTVNTPWDLTTINITPIASLDLSNIENVIVEGSISITNNGNKIVFAGNDTDTISSIDLSTPWDLSTADTNTLSSLNKIILNNTDPRGLFIYPDNATVSVLKGSTATIQKLITDLTPKLTDYTISQSFKHGRTYTEDVSLNNDGSKMYVVKYNTDSIYQYSLSTPFDITTASEEYVLSTTGEENSPRALAWNGDGSVCYISGGSEDGGFYNLTIPFDLTSATLTIPTTNHFLRANGSLNTSIEGAFLNDNGTKLVLITNVGYISEYVTETPYQFPQSPTNEINVESIDSNANSLTFNSDMSKIFWVGGTTDQLFEMDLTTPSDISTINTTDYRSVLNPSFSNPTGIFFNETRDEIYINDYNTHTVYKFTR